MAPRREGGAWVKKTPAGEKSKEEEEAPNFKGREGKGKGRSKGRHEDSPEGKPKGRSKGKHHKEEGRESNSGDDETEDGGNALLKMLKGNNQKRYSYTKQELFNIAKLPASNVKPPDLDPIVDKDNKDSVLLIRIAATREKEEEAANGEERRRSKREARPEAEEAEPEEPKDEEEQAKAFEKWLGKNMPKLEAAKAELTAKAAAGSGSSLSSSAPKWPGPKSGSSANYMQSLLNQGGAQGSGMSQAHAMQAAAYMQAMTQMQIAAAASRQGYGYGSQSWNSNPYLNHYMGAYGGGFGGLDAYSLQQQAAANLSEAMQAKLGALSQARAAAAAKAAAKMSAKAAAKPKATAKSVSPKTVPKAQPKTPTVAPAVAGLLPKTSAPSSPQLAPAVAPVAPLAPAATVVAGAGVAGAGVATGVATAPPSSPGKKDEEDEAGCSQS